MLRARVRRPGTLTAGVLRLVTCKHKQIETFKSSECHIININHSRRTARCLAACPHAAWASKAVAHDDTFMIGRQDMSSIRCRPIFARGPCPKKTSSARPQADLRGLVSRGTGSSATDGSAMDRRLVQSNLGTPSNVLSTLFLGPELGRHPITGSGERFRE